MTNPAPFPIIARPAVRSLGASLIRELANDAMGREGVLPFWFGEADRPTPPAIVSAATRSLHDGETRYSENLGRPWLRQALSDYLGELHGRAIPASRIAVTSSGVSALMLAAQLLLSPGDRCVAVTPLWPNIAEIPRILGASVERVPLTVRDGRWVLDLDRLFAALTPGTRALILNSPNNPTGWTIDEISLTAILAFCRRRGIWILSDDVYERLVHDPARRSAPSFFAHNEEGDRLVAVNSFSKAWSMTGWRIGWIVAPAPLLGNLATLIEYNTSCLPEPMQRGALAALRHGEPAIADLREQLRATREWLATALRALPGVEVPEAGGAMYVWFRIAGFDDGVTLAKRLVEEAGLGLAPGEAFGPEGAGWLRWCHAVEMEKLVEGVRRLEVFLQKSGSARRPAQASSI